MIPAEHLTRSELIYIRSFVVTAIVLVLFKPLLYVIKAMKKGLLLINLGTPERPDNSTVRRYLREFLTDKRVIALPALVRYLLVYGIILPLRTARSAKAYQAIWTSDGSPLLHHSLNLLNKLQSRLGANWQVALGMRYGQPSLANAIQELNHCYKLTILPLYPQYASATTGSSIAKVLDLLSLAKGFPSLEFIRDFYWQPEFIKAQATLIKPYAAQHDFILFSYHGLPERHLFQAGCTKICVGECHPMIETNQFCYKAQCHATTRALAITLNLKPGTYETAFQSRLGNTEWLKPYTTDLLHTLRQQGIKRLAVYCPSFVTDCLETEEEIGLRAKKQWTQLGGEQLTLIPCLNDNDLWVDAIVKLCA